MDSGAPLHDLQRQTFDYFQHETNPVNGLVIDKTAPGRPVSIAATGYQGFFVSRARRPRPTSPPRR